MPHLSIGTGCRVGLSWPADLQSRCGRSCRRWSTPNPSACPFVVFSLVAGPGTLVLEITGPAADDLLDGHSRRSDVTGADHRPIT
jgi:hypothetical protein